MDVLKNFIITYKGLGIGNHEYKFVVDNSFLGMFEGTDIRGTEAQVEMNLQKQGNAMILDFKIKGSVKVDCDRCLEEIELPLDIESKVNVKFSEEVIESDGEIIWVHPSEDTISVAQYIYETIYLSLPYSRIHRSDQNGQSTCNQDMLSRFTTSENQEWEEEEEEEDV